MPFDGSGLSQVTRDLIAARELLVEKGWVPWCGTPIEGPHCMITALGEVNACGKAHRALYAQIDPTRPWVGMAQFNDSQTSVEPILALFDAAIAAGE